MSYLNRDKIIQKYKNSEYPNRVQNPKIPTPSPYLLFSIYNYGNLIELILDDDPEHVSKTKILYNIIRRTWSSSLIEEKTVYEEIAADLGYVSQFTYKEKFKELRDKLEIIKSNRV